VVVRVGVLEGGIGLGGSSEVNGRDANDKGGAGSLFYLPWPHP